MTIQQMFRNCFFRLPYFSILFFASLTVHADQQYKEMTSLIADARQEVRNKEEDLQKIRTSRDKLDPAPLDILTRPEYAGNCNRNCTPGLGTKCRKSDF